MLTGLPMPLQCTGVQRSHLTIGTTSPGPISTNIALKILLVGDQDASLVDALGSNLSLHMNGPTTLIGLPRCVGSSAVPDDDAYLHPGQKALHARGLRPIFNPQCARCQSGQTSVDAVEEPWLPLQSLSADAPGAAEPQCSLTGGRPLLHATAM
jgi:hypothetical protein